MKQFKYTIVPIATKTIKGKDNYLCIEELNDYGDNGCELVAIDIVDNTKNYIFKREIIPC